MKILISADMESITGVTRWDDVSQSADSYEYFRSLMNREVVAACEGALAGGAQQVWVKDAHDSACNLRVGELPREVRLLSGWSGHPYAMVQGLDESFDGVVFVGYHSPAGSDGHPLAHTMNSRRIQAVFINGELASEFLIHSYVACSLGVPIRFVAGDQELCKRVKEFSTNIETVTTSIGIGDSVESLHPALIEQEIRSSVERSMRALIPAEECPQTFETEVHYASHQEAYRISFYPGARRLGARQVGFSGIDYFDVMRFFAFAL